MNLYERLKEEHKGKIRTSIIERVKDYDYYSSIPVDLACDLFWEIYPLKPFELGEFQKIFNDNNR
jgi:hypothetical protein